MQTAPRRSRGPAAYGNMWTKAESTAKPKQGKLGLPSRIRRAAEVRQLNSVRSCRHPSSPTADVLSLARFLFGFLFTCQHRE